MAHESNVSNIYLYIGNIRRAAKPASKKPFLNINRVAGLDRLVDRDVDREGAAVLGAGQLGVIFARARRKAAGDRHGGFDSHAVDIRILAGGRHLAEYEKGPIGFDLDGNAGLADISIAQFFLDLPRELHRGAAGGGHRADQWHGDMARTVDGEGIAQRILAEHDDAQTVAGGEHIGRCGLSLELHVAGGSVGATLKRRRQGQSQGPSNEQKGSTHLH